MVIPHFFKFWKFRSNDIDQAPNALRLDRERLPPVVLDRYRSRRKRYHIYNAAVQLYGEGIEFERALAIVNEAFDASIFEDTQDA